jgi:hypothetical protein
MESKLQSMLVLLLGFLWKSGRTRLQMQNNALHQTASFEALTKRY